MYEKKLAESVEVEQRTSRYGSELVIIATAQSGHTSAELEQAIDAELERLDAAPPTDDEVERARAFVQTKLLHDIEPPVQLASALNWFELRFGDAAELDQRYLARYDAVDGGRGGGVGEARCCTRRKRHRRGRARRSRQVRASLLLLAAMLTLVGSPTRAATPTRAEQPDLSQRPPLPPQPSW